MWGLIRVPTTKIGYGEKTEINSTLWVSNAELCISKYRSITHGPRLQRTCSLTELTSTNALYNITNFNRNSGITCQVASYQEKPRRVKGNRACPGMLEEGFWGTRFAYANEGGWDMKIRGLSNNKLLFLLLVPICTIQKENSHFRINLGFVQVYFIIFVLQKKENWGTAGVKLDFIIRVLAPPATNYVNN